MKKRRQRPQQTSKYNSSTLEETQIQEISMENNDVLVSQKNYNPSQHNLNKKASQNSSANSNSCLESAKQKMALYFFHFLNYLQFDRAFTKEEFQALKSENYIFKSKFPDNYYLSYEQRAKKFGITVQEMMKKKEHEQEIKTKSLWTRVKKFVCCEGEDELEEADQMITAASQSDFFYLTKVQAAKGKNQLELTEESMIQKPSNYLTNNLDKKHRLVKEKSFENTHDQFFFQQKEDNDLPFNKGNSPKMQKQTQSNNKQIDFNEIKNVQKRQHKKKQTVQNIQNNQVQDEMNKSLIQKKNKKDTQKVYIQRKSDDEKEEQIDLGRIKNHVKKEDTQNEDQICLANQKIDDTFLQRPNGQKSQDNYVDHKYVEQISEISEVNEKAKINRNQSESTIANRGIDSLKNSFKLSKQNFQSQNHSFDISSNNPSTQKMLPLNESQFEVQDPTNIFRQQNVDSSYIPLDQSDIISVAQSQAQPISKDPTVKKQNKRKNRRKNSIQKPEEDLQVIQFKNQNHEQDLQDIQNLQNQTVEDDIIQQSEPTQVERKQNYSASSDQLGRKAKKNNLKFDSFDGLDFTIKEGRYEDDNQKQQPNQISFDDTKSNGNLTERGQQAKVSKKKKNRNKKLFNLQEEEQAVNEVVFFPENQNDNFNEKPANKTISFQDSFSNVMNDSIVAKKRRKNKKIKDLNFDKNDEVIVLEAGQMLENIQMNDQPRNQPKKNEVNQLNAETENLGVLSSVKVEKKKKRKAKLREQIEKQEQQMQIVDLGEIN